MNRTLLIKQVRYFMKIKYKKYIFTFLLFVVTFSNFSLLGCRSSPEQYERVEENFQEIKVGMDKDEVQLLVGEPMKIYKWKPALDSEPTEERWLLHFPPDPNELPSVTFDSKTSRVIRVEKVDPEFFDP